MKPLMQLKEGHIDFKLISLEPELAKGRSYLIDLWPQLQLIILKLLRPLGVLDGFTFDVIRLAVHTRAMIKTFADKETQSLFEGGSPRRFRAFQSVAERKLQQLDSAETLEFLRSPPGNRLEALKEDREGQYSIRINGRWRLCFRWADGDAYDVVIVDYH